MAFNVKWSNLLTGKSPISLNPTISGRHAALVETFAETAIDQNTANTLAASVVTPPCKPRPKVYGRFHPAVEERQETAKNPDTPIDTLRQLLNDRAPSVRSALARRSDLPQDMIYALAADRSPEVRHTLAAYGTPGADILDVLALDAHYLPRCGVAANLTTTADTLRALSADVDNRVLYELAKNPNTPSDVLLRLAEATDSSLLYVLARNSQTPSDGLTRIVNHCVADSCPDNLFYVLRAIAANLSAPPALLAQLARHEESSVRERVAAHPATPVSALEELVEDQEIPGHIIAYHPKLPVERLRWMAIHDCRGKEAARNRLVELMQVRIEDSCAAALSAHDPHIALLLEAACSAQQAYINASNTLIEALNLPSNVVAPERLHNLCRLGSKNKFFRWDSDLCPWFMEWSISYLDLPRATLNSLWRSDLETVGDLAKVSVAELKTIRSLDRKDRDEIEELLDLQFGIRLEGSTRPLQDNS